MPFKKKSQFQLTFLSVLLIILMLLYTAKIYSLQIVNADEYTEKNIGAASSITSVLKAPRGEILDCYGRQIAYNRDGYNIVFNKAYIGDNLNDVILTLANLLKEYDTEWIDKLPITMSSPYEFTEDGNTDKLIKTLDVAHYATAENCMQRLTERYELEGYSTVEQRIIMGVRYTMEIQDFSISYPHTFAEDIPTELMRKISESGFLLSGISIDVVPFREYSDTSLAVNLIGTVGPIYEEDWEGEDGENYKSRGYSYNDKVGKSGIEYWAEEYLHGTDGEITYFLDANGDIISSEVTLEPQAGKTVMLTLDRAIQREAQDALANTILTLQSEGGTAVAGAAVAIDINSGSVICAANYPTYDLATLGEMYESISNAEVSPLINRAFKGIYPIGSTIKPIVAVSAIDNGKYNIGETIQCLHTYRYFSDYTPSCMGTHGHINLTTALSKSCNYFFFDLATRLGAKSMTDYFKQFGLGVPTGVEVDDSSGLLVEPDADGMGGDTLQIAIGQLNAFTPLQLANYTATLANGGTRYSATLIDKIISYDFSVVYEENKPEVLNEVDISETALSNVKEGMLSVTVDGTGQAALGDYPIKIGGKTGTSQVINGADNSVFIAFAPYDKPEIAIAVVLEHGNSGYSAGSIVRSILDAYFYSDYNSSEDTVPFVVLD